MPHPHPARQHRGDYQWSQEELAETARERKEGVGEEGSHEEGGGGVCSDRRRGGKKREGGDEGELVIVLQRWRRGNLPRLPEGRWRQW